MKKVRCSGSCPKATRKGGYADAFRLGMVRARLDAAKGRVHVTPK
ncbi:MAG: hypothetical protein PHF51_01655 [Candidatus ainarchaeum sp.]|nr:hypothetical protein [Candidatus ainarchaeum sp.]